jgi:D-alanyl-D-alanine-carboxypeptidase/D-alanyl-D-alanine-endopeptidase
LRTLKLHGKPGESMKYSNVGYAVLGYALERASRKSYDTLLREYVTGPLALNETVTTTTVEAAPDSPTASRARGTPLIGSSSSSAIVAFFLR